MFRFKKPTAIDVIDAIVSFFTEEELEKMELENPVREVFRQHLIIRCGQMKPRFSVQKSVNMFLDSKAILYSRYESDSPVYLLWTRYCHDNLFE